MSRCVDLVHLVPHGPHSLHPRDPSCIPQIDSSRTRPRKKQGRYRHSPANVVTLWNEGHTEGPGHAEETHISLMRIFLLIPLTVRPAMLHDTRPSHTMQPWTTGRPFIRNGPCISLHIWSRRQRASRQAGRGSHYRSHEQPGQGQALVFSSLRGRKVGRGGWCEDNRVGDARRQCMALERGVTSQHRLEQPTAFTGGQAMHPSMICFSCHRAVIDRVSATSGPLPRQDRKIWL